MINVMYDGEIVFSTDSFEAAVSYAEFYQYKICIQCRISYTEAGSKISIVWSE